MPNAVTPRYSNYIARMSKVGDTTIVGKAALHLRSECGRLPEYVTQFGQDGPLLKLTNQDGTPFIGSGGRKEQGEIKGETVQDAVQLYLKTHTTRAVKADETDQGISSERKRKRKVP